MTRCTEWSSGEYVPSVQCDLEEGHGMPHRAVAGSNAIVTWEPATVRLNFIEDEKRTEGEK